jgi:hypothetical protein
MMASYVRSKSKGRVGLSPFAHQLLQRIATWQRDAGVYAKPSDIVAAGGRRDWITLQSLLGRGLLNTTEDSHIRITGEGWRHLREHRG